VPGVGGLVLGTPMFDRATLKLAGNRTVILSRQGPGIYVQSLKLNGTPYASTWLPLSKLQSGVMEMQFTMGTESNVQRGVAVEDRPPSFR
jgi:putative alpha-1,2-mannosidase